MSTPNIPDDELDDFFRKLLQEPHIAFDEEAWAKMEQKMAKEAGRQAIFRRFLYTLLLLIGAFTGVVLWYILDEKTSVTLTDNHNVSQINEQSAGEAHYPLKAVPIEGNKPADSVTSQGIEAEENNRTQVFKERERANYLPTPLESKKNIPAKERLSNLHEKDKNSVRIQPDRSKPGRSIQTNPVQENAPGVLTEKQHKTNNNASKKTKLTDPAKEINFLTPDNKTDKKAKPGNTTSLFSKERKQIVKEALNKETSNEDAPFTNVNIKLLRSLSINNSGRPPQDLPFLPESSISKIPGIIELKDTTDQQKVAKRRFPGFGVGVTISPDMSSVGFANWARPGTNAGLVIEYFISDRWSLSTGAVYSTKIYSAAGEDYTPPKGLWGAYKIWPVEVDANCKVLDIPLNVRYNIINKEKYNVFVNTGLSSYLMLKEDYRYIYSDDVNDKYLRKSWSTENEFRHFFSVVNISAGYEKRLGNRLSLQAEPYLKLPLAGVGFGKIKLLSTGVFFSLKYRLYQ